MPVRWAIGLLWLAVIIGTSPAPADAQRTGFRPRSTVGASVPVDSSVSTLTKDQRATSLSQLAKRFAGPPKDEFDTAEGYVAKVADLTVPRGFYVAEFKNAKVADECDHDLTYDAEKGVWRVKVRGDQYYYPKTGGGDSYDVLRVVCTEVLGDTYVGRNSFGVARAIRKVQGFQYGIAINPWSTKFANRRGGSWGWVEFPMAPEDARRWKDRLIPMALFAVAVSPDGPIVLRDTSGYRPTISFPYDVDVFRQSIFADQLELLLVDRGTGTVVARSGTLFEKSPY